MQNRAPRARPGKLRDVSNKLPQRKQREHRGLSQVSSILVNRFFCSVLLFEENRDSRLKSEIFLIAF